MASLAPITGHLRKNAGIERRDDPRLFVGNHDACCDCSRTRVASQTQLLFGLPTLGNIHCDTDANPAAIIEFSQRRRIEIPKAATEPSLQRSRYSLLSRRSSLSNKLATRAHASSR